MTVESEFLTFSADKLTQLMDRIEFCAGKLTPEQIWARGSESQNAVGNLLLHLNGNLRQWILHGVGGAPDQRDRDSEFAARDGGAATELLTRLRSSVDEAAALIRSLPTSRLLERHSVQDYDVTVLGAIYHVVEHFSGHAFQIFLLTKMFTGEDLRFYAHLSSPKPRTSPQP
jgi:uncharacterized protein DUF1572